MSATAITDIGTHKVKNVATGEAVDIKSFWENQDVAIVFFRRWGCMFCRLWAKELSEISPVLKRNNIKLVGIGVEEIGSKEFVKGKYFDGDLYYAEDISTYQKLGFKRFNVVSIITSLFWKQTREAIVKGRSLGIETDITGDGLQNGGLIIVKNGGKIAKDFIQSGPGDYLTNEEIIKVGGAVLVQKGGNLLRHFVQTGPGEHLSNEEILKTFGLEKEYNPETMANKNRADTQCTTEAKP